MTHHTFAAIISAELVAPATTEVQPPYYPPAVVYEASLEVRAGTPIPNPIDPLDLS